MDTVSEESLGLCAEPFFNGFSDLIVVCEPAWPEHMEIAGRQVGAVGGGDGELPIGSAASDLCKLLPHEDGHCPATE